MQMVRVVFEHSDGTELVVQAPVGLSMLEVAREHDVDIEGACGGALACATCHVIVDKEWYHQVGEPSEDEEDMLDMAVGLTPTSRLCCQIILTPELDGLRVMIPPNSRNIR